MIPLVIRTVFFALSLSTAAQVSAATYLLTDEIIGLSFYDAFIWESFADPTNGRVSYVDRVTSDMMNLTFASPDTFILRADSENVLDPSGPGRNSVRIRSKQTYTSHVSVFDVRHMPQGCGTWPAIWQTKPANDWPVGGELDILEGVNDAGPNVATLHTTPGCSMPELREQAGTSLRTDCDYRLDNMGCSVEFPDDYSYGPSFNEKGGGWFAVERTWSHIKVWFWSRGDSSLPQDVLFGGAEIDPDSWGLPMAYFPDTSCNMAEHFHEHSIIINLTFCGDWAGSTYGQSGCPSTCEDFVNSNPWEFADAYFDLGAIRVYQ
ncbi:glycoside hydrolase family 16 protein [Gymnopilus junonius]|uniref:Glycoside hydrolase family 16 protein n=1 Tax=Gymnopilus junonius TaxID=109634 RepID=A0A9P5TMF7_GYMJU|nr:glycoside hydrolase family 16 protein [Gymnopilus junonius]